MANKVSVASLVKACNLSVYVGEKYTKERFITTSDISRPGLELTGYFDYYPEERVQLLGMTEISYVHKMKEEDKVKYLDKLCGKTTPCFIVSRDWLFRQNWSGLLLHMIFRFYGLSFLRPVYFPKLLTI